MINPAHDLFIALSIIFMISSCNAPRGENSSSEALENDNSFSEYDPMFRPIKSLMTSGSSIVRVRDTLHNGIVYTYSIEANSNYIASKDAKFSTPEGIRGGSHFNELIERGGQFWNEPGWGPVVTLPSGWKAYIDCHWDSVAQGFIINEDSLTANLFRRDRSKDW